MEWHKRDHRAALDGYMGLTLEERGAYTTLLDLMYERGEALPDNERLIAGHLETSVRKYRALRDSLIAKGKIQRADGGRLTNARFEKECESSVNARRTLRESGAKGGRKRVENLKNVNENNEGGQARLEPASSSRARLEGERDTLTNVSGAVAPLDDPVKSIFDIGVRLLVRAGTPDRQARSLIGKWRRDASDAELLAVLPEAAGKSDPAAWITAALAARSRPTFDRLADSIERYRHLPPAPKIVAIQ
ncbi:DUF1376 domain-containing protein [Sphingomonas naphthae]|uniref:DUF1376 domain-containing protein n=1 Tax=Sphingomonas naphthae TaxID=1813468 RepID=A0ABY7TT73_9SPHN|nr:DUF1376 domain-containing protein [Sphingomonas naphthae]WCT75419.1 DUF1376 domain-containing protein [Sphingomonas naphthae]